MTTQSDSSSENSDSIRPTQSRKSYNSPVLQRFGQLSRLTQGSGGRGNDGGGVMTMMSDRETKHRLVPVGLLPTGIYLYLFSYLPLHGGSSKGRQLGVMADEVATILPEAVSFDEHGYKVVNYTMLDIRPTDSIHAFMHG